MSNKILECSLVDIEKTVEEAFATGKTPLIIDNSDEDKICTFYSYQGDAIILEAKQIILRGMNKNDIELLEPFRTKLVNSMKYGKLLVIRLANSAPSLYSKWNDESLGHNNTNIASAYFPKALFYNGGKLIKADESWPERLFRREDKEPHNLSYCLDGFKVLFTSQFELEDLDDFLFKTEALPPKENFQIVYIKPEN